MPIQKRYKVVPLLIKITSVTVLIIVVFSFKSPAEEMSHGEMAGIIRAAGHPCARVLELQSVGKNSWKVKCNSGNFSVIRNTDGEYNITFSDE